MNKSIIQLIIANFKVFFREPSILFWALLFPILMSWVLGIAFTNKGEQTKTVYFIDGKTEGKYFTAAQEKVLGTETGNPVRIKFLKTSREKADQAIKRGEIALYLEERNDSVIFYFDPSNPDAQLTHLILERELSGSVKEKNSDSSQYLSAVSPLTTRGTRYIDFLIPGLMAFGIMSSCLWGISWNLIELRMKKLLRRMVATPMKKSYFLASHIITRIVLSSFESFLLFIFAFLYFGTIVEGSFAALAMVYLAGIFAFSGISILTGSRTHSSQVGNGLINFITLPMTILSGVFFNYHNFPDWAIPVIKMLPLTLLADTIRSIFIEGTGFGEALAPALILSAIGLVTFVAGLRIFKWY